MNLRYLFKGVSVAAEREFERSNVEAKRERYLATNPLDRYADDPEYQAKVDRIGNALKDIKGYVLDIGGNTAGEATILRQRGMRIVVGDINEKALEISRERVEKYGLVAPEYVALDAHNLPFQENAFDAITVIETLHHFVDWSRCLKEIQRVLKPGGKLFSTEPNALNPLRRLSEVRDRMRGTIEKSFYPEQLRRLCEAAGFASVKVAPLPAGRSTWKLEEVPAYRRPVARLHGWLSVHHPRVFGSLQLEAAKGGGAPSQAPVPKLSDLFRSPTGGRKLSYDAGRRCWAEENGRFGFPDLNGIPVLIEEEKIALLEPEMVK